MKVFISWSGDRSNKVARALSEWLPSVIQAVKPWMSGQIAKGARWSPEIAKELQETSFGIVCVTPENPNAPWLLFETGALSKTIEGTHVCPYLLDVKRTDLEGPLTQFQAATAERNDTLELVKSINSAQGENALPVKSVEAGFDMWWPKLDEQLREIEREAVSPRKEVKRSELDLLEEILDTVRQLRRDTAITPPTGAIEITSPPVLDTAAYREAWAKIMLSQTEAMHKLLSRHGEPSKQTSEQDATKKSKPKSDSDK